MIVFEYLPSYSFLQIKAGNISTIGLYWLSQHNNNGHCKTHLTFLYQTGNGAYQRHCPFLYCYCRQKYPCALNICIIVFGAAAASRWFPGNKAAAPPKRRRSPVCSAAYANDSIGIVLSH